MSGSKEFHEIIECDLQHVVPDNVQVKFTDAVEFRNANIHTGLAADPDVDNDTLGHKERYTDRTGGFYFNTVANKFKYKGGDPIQWRFFGDGDGDVTYFGTEQADNGVARWHSVTRQIQGSDATLDDSGNFETPGYYLSRQGSTLDRTFVSHLALDVEDAFIMRANGDHEWGNGADPTDTVLGRLGVNHLGSDEPNMQLSLREGDSRISAQRHLGGLGNAQGNSNFRCPMMVDRIVRWASPLVTGGSGTLSTEIFTHNIPAKGLQDGDTLDIDVFFQTGNAASVKRLDMTLNTTPNISIQLPIVGGSFLAGWAKFTLIRQDQSTAILMGVGMHGGSVLLTAPLGNTSFNNSGDWEANSYQVAIRAVIVGDVSDTPADDLIIEGGRLTYYNY